MKQRINLVYIVLVHMLLEAMLIVQVALMVIRGYATAVIFHLLMLQEDFAEEQYIVTRERVP